MKLFWLFILLTTPLFSQPTMNIATSTDTEHYTWTLNLIAGLHKYNGDQLNEIAVFDLGLLEEEIQSLNKLAYVKVYAVEKTNPQILKKFIVNQTGKIARGWYSWKPVVIKQASDLFEEFFYLDSGVTIQGPLEPLFEHLHERGYFLMDCGQEIKRMTTKPVAAAFKLNTPENRWILNQLGISAGIQGLSRRVRTSYIQPLYSLSYHLEYFEDDGTCPKGFGSSRHDQTLFSIQARLLGLNVFEIIRGGKMALQVGEKTFFAPMGTFFKLSRGEFNLEKIKQDLRWKDGYDL